MTLYSPKISQLLQGVSRQDQSLRSEGQLQEQVNCISDLVQGLRRRPRWKLMDEPIIRHNADITEETAYTTWMYERGDGTEAYIILIAADGGWQVYNAYTGEPIDTTQYTTGPIHDYMSDSDPRNNLGFCTIGDKTFLLNKTVEVEDSSATQFDKQPGILIWCKKWSFGKDIRVYQAGSKKADVAAINEVTPTAGNVDKRLDMNSDTLAINIATQLGTSGYYAHNMGSVVWVPGDGRSGTLSAIDDWWRVDDGSNGDDVVVINAEVTNYEELPPFAPNDFSVKVKGLGNSDYDDFFVRFENDAGTNWLTLLQKNGKWVECSDPDQYNAFDQYTMPLQIVRSFSGVVPYFHITSASWEDREAGNDDTNPFPSFVGKTINDIFVYKNRLWFLSGENACATRAFSYLNWWAASVAAPSDEDPIDSSSSDNTITELKYGVVNNKDLLIFSNKTQFLWDGANDVKPSTFSLEVSTKYPTDPISKPIAFGDGVIVPTDGGDRIIVWEFTKDPLSGLPAAEDLTKHIGEYISNNPRIVPNFITLHEFPGVESMAAHANKGMLFLTIGGDVFVLQTSKKERDRIQQAWHKWTIAPMEDYVGWWILKGYTEHPTVSDVFVVGNQLVALARMDSFTGPRYNPRWVTMGLDLQFSTTDDPEVFMDFQFDSFGVQTSGPYYFAGSWYDCYATLPYFYWPDDDAAPPSGYEREAFFDSIVVGDVEPATEGNATTIPKGAALPYDWALDSTAYPTFPKVYFNVPPTWLSSNDSFDIRLGCRYDSYFTLSKPYVVDQRGKVYTEDTVVDDVVMEMRDTVYFEVDVDNSAGDGYTHEFNGQALNDFRYKLGAANHVTRTEPVAIYNDRELMDVTVRANESMYGFGFNGCTWHVNMHSNGRRV